MKMKKRGMQRALKRRYEGKRDIGKVRGERKGTREKGMGEGTENEENIEEGIEKKGRCGNKWGKINKGNVRQDKV